MTHKIIKVDNYLLVVDDSEIKVGDYFYSIREIVEQAVIDYPKNEHHGVIIAHLPLNGSPILKGVDLLPPIEDDVDKLAFNYVTEDGKYGLHDDAHRELFSFKAGYNKAREKYKYTKEDVWKAIVISKLPSEYGDYLTINDIIQSLHQITEFQREMENYCGSPITTDRCPKCIDSCDKAYQRPKTITTAQGIQWVGKYK